MSSEEETEEKVLNEHNPAPPTEKIWMPVYQDEDKKLAKHDWCLDTGIIKNLSGEEAKPKGFYISVLNKMKYILEHNLGHSRGAPKFPEAQIKLILKDLDKIDGFYDKWWRTESSQLEAFIRVVQNRRTDLSQRFIIDSVTRTLRG
ncbi:MAG: hypothetical protein CMB06_00540 [Euryarchaeota archaeon]|nr:hypothetical protein [Euryarchaeota archaeon]|tara:strand:+ start:72 stop:509 length:438 start_codon:yes stop_codon:yes gene_type:complete